MNHSHEIKGSANVHSAATINGKTLIGFHKNGTITGIYEYEAPEGTCCSLASAESAGKFVAQNIKKLPCVRLYPRG